MIRIRTTFDKHNRIFTILFNNEWVTFYTSNGKSNSMEASSLLEAGQNHLQCCKIVQSQIIKSDGGSL